MWFCHAVVRWQNPSAELNDMFSKVQIPQILHFNIDNQPEQILHAFSQMAGAQWENQMLSFGPSIAERLRARYNV